MEQAELSERSQADQRRRVTDYYGHAGDPQRVPPARSALALGAVRARDSPTGSVKLSYVGDVGLHQVSAPDVCEGNGLLLASLDDLFGTKCATVPQRNATRDYLDIHALVTTAQLSLAHGIACARAIHAQEYVPTMTLQALSYFNDLPEPLPDSMKQDLLAAVKSASLESLPKIEASPRIGAGPPAPPPVAQLCMPVPERSLEDVARSVNWYTPPAQVLANQNLFLCEVMARGTLEDILVVRKHYSWDAFTQAYQHAPPGLFTPRAWAYWGLKLFGDPQALPIPQRFPGKAFDWRRRTPEP